jgi:hypothetical protein
MTARWTVAVPLLAPVPLAPAIAVASIWLEGP